MNKNAFESTLLSLLPALLALLTGCAEVPYRNASDPWEPVNRPIYDLNDAIDRLVLKPVSDAYIRVTSEPVRASVSNFYDNAAYPETVLNNLLQGKAVAAASDTGRFVVNTTLGIGGLFDVAATMGLPKHEEDFGQTLGVWGSPPGPYMVLPVAGPYTVRDTLSIPVALVTNALFYINTGPAAIPLTVLAAVDLRSRASNAIRFRNAAALDPYLFTREAYLQHREFLVHDGNPPLPDFPDFQDFEEDFPPLDGAAPR